MGQSTKKISLLSFFIIFTLASANASFARAERINPLEPTAQAKWILYPLLFVTSTIISYLADYTVTKMLEVENLEPLSAELKEEQEKAFVFRPSSLLIRMTTEAAFREWIIKQDMSIGTMARLINGFSAGLKVPIYTRFLRQISEIYPDMVPLLSIIKEFYATLLDALEMNMSQLKQNVKVSSSYDNLGYPLAFGHNTTPTCGIYDRYCTRIPNYQGQKQDAYLGWSDVDSFLFASLRVTLLAASLGLGILYALFTNKLEQIPFKIFQGKIGQKIGLSPGLGFFIARTLNSYYVDGKVNEHAEKILVQLIKEYLMPFFHDTSNRDQLITSEDVKEAIDFGKDSNTLILRGHLSAKKLKDIQTPVAAFITKVLYGYKEKN